MVTPEKILNLKRTKMKGLIPMVCIGTTCTPSGIFRIKIVQLIVNYL